MKKIVAIPTFITVLQLVCVFHLYYIHKYKSTHIPADLIELNILVFCNSIILIVGYVFYPKQQNKYNLWLLPIGIALIYIIVLIIVYAVMLIYKYK